MLLFQAEDKFKNRGGISSIVPRTIHPLEADAAAVLKSSSLQTLLIATLLYHFICLCLEMCSCPTNYF